MPQRKRRHREEALTAAQIAAEDAAALPSREALSLLDPALVANATGLVPGTEQTTADSAQTASQTTTQTSQLANQSAAQLSDVATDAATSEEAASQPYQPSVSSIARS